MTHRSTLIFLIFLSLFLSNLQVFAGSDSSDNDSSDSSDGDYLAKIDRDLRGKLSSGASIVHFSSAAPRWSDYYSPRPGTIVNVAEEKDVVETVKYCVKHNLDFLAQSGAHGWATTFKIAEKDVIINMRGLNQVHVNTAKTEITFGGGAIISEVVEGAYQNQVHVPTGNCNCVGALGAILGGGLGRLQGRYGLGVDNLLSVNLVTADGKLKVITPTSSPDLWWAIRGAGANFGIVTSATMKAYPQVNNGVAWIGTLIYTPDKLEALVQTISDLEYEKEMALHFIFAAAPPDFTTPSIIVRPWYSGSEAQGKAAWKALYDIGPVFESSGELPYNLINSGDDGFCLKGGRKPAYTVGMKKLDPATFRTIWDEFVALISENPGLKQTSMLVECYSYKTVRQFPDSSSAFPHRSVNFHALVIPWYDDASLDTIATDFAKDVRQLWRETSGFSENRAYINFAHGDEEYKTVYGNSLTRLRDIKKKWDKDGQFSQFFPIPRR